MFKKFMEGAVFAIAFTAALIGLVVGVCVGIQTLADILGAKTVGVLCAIILVGTIGGLSALFPSSGTGPR